MPLHPELERYLARAAASGAPNRGAMSVAETREFYRGMAALAGEAPNLPRVEDIRIPGGRGTVTVRVYDPSERGNLPVFLYIHGGRFFSGDLETHDPVCRMLAARSGWMIVAVDYRLAPEHKWPAAVEDCFAASIWLAANAAAIGADPEWMGIGGDSAGGNLAAVVAQLRRHAEPKPVGQLLLYPMMDATCSLSAHTEFARGYGPGSDDMRRGYDLYVPDGIDRRDPRISPLWAADFSGLPPTCIVTAEYDSLRDDGEEYAWKLRQAGVPVAVRRYDGAIHGFFQLAGVCELGREAVRNAANFLRGIASGSD